MPPAGTKREAPTSRPAAKRPRVTVPAHHLTPSGTAPDGPVQWPAPRRQIERAREVIRASSSAPGTTVLIVPDKDADGLSSGAILRHALVLLGSPPETVHVHLLSKGNTIHAEAERRAIAAFRPPYVFVVDHGSRAGPPVVDADTTTVLIIDHHHATESDFPTNSEHVTACRSPPVATSALLTYEICQPLHPGVRDKCAWLCVVGTHGDLGNALKWEPPFPDMREPLKRYTKKLVTDVVSLVNAPRRTAAYDVRSAWDALCDADAPASVLANRRLLAARAEVNDEVERCTHTAPKFSADGKVAVLRIKSEAQVHPVIATRWSGHLQSKALEMVMVANEGYLPGKINFSCRIPRCARNRDPPISLIERLRHYASLPDPGADADADADAPPAGEPRLLDRVGDDFARGHPEASGGIVDVGHFEALMRILAMGRKPAAEAGRPGARGAAQRRKAVVDLGQRTTLLGYFSRAGEGGQAGT